MAFVAKRLFDMAISYVWKSTYAFSWSAIAHIAILFWGY